MSFTKIDSNNITATGVTAGSYTNANITVNEAGQITSASNGVAGTGGSGGGSTGLQHTTYTYTGNGSTTTFSATSGLTVHTVLVIVDGVTQTPTTNYTISGSNIVFTSAPPASSDIQIRVLGDVASSGGGPKISNIAIVDSNWDALDDTAVDIAGGYIKITGTGFVSGCLAYFNQTAAASISFVSSTELRISTGALAASTYVLYVINPDGGVAISVPGVTFSATPAWQTASSLSDQYDGVAITLSLVAQDATSYTLVSGSLPPGLTLNTSTGAITGTVTGVTVDTTYTFTVRATDAQLQDSPRTFTVTITVSDPYFNRTTLLLSGSAISANTVIRDSSTNNFNLTVAGDARASSFTPYGTGWSVYFDGTGDSLSISDNPVLDLGNSEFCIELWHYPTVFGAGWLFSKQTNYLSATGYLLRTQTTTGYIEFSAGSSGASWDIANIVTSQVPTLNAWNHIAVTRSSTDNRIRVFLNGALAGLTGVTTASIQDTSAQFTIGNDSGGSVGCTGYISNFRLVKGSIPAAYQTASTTVGISQIFVPPTQPLTAVANTSLLTCNANRFLDSSTNNLTITCNGDAKVTGFNPFGITNTGTSGSAYFDGTGDYLSAASNTALNLTGDYTVECWFYANSFPAQPALFGIGSDAAGLVLTIVSSKVYAYVVGVGNVFGSGGTTLITNSWNHIAIVRSGTTNTCYINGSQSGTTYSSSATISSTGGVGIGRTLTGTAFNDWNGYVADFRIVKGTAVYTGAFTPPTQPLTNIANTQLLTLQYKQPHNNHSFQDSSTNNHLITRSGNATQGTFSPFSQTGWGNYFDGSGDYLSVPANAAFQLGTGDFSIEAWIYPTTTPGGQYPVVIRLESGGYNSNGLTLFWRRYNVNPNGISVDCGGVVALAGTSTVALNTWTHVAVTRTGTTFALFVNGTREATTTSSNNFSVNDSVYIGDGTSDTEFPGYISNVRIVKGSNVYGVGTTLTVPTAPLTAISGTSLLTCQSNRFIDNSGNNFTVTPAGNASVQAFSPFNPTASWSAATYGGSGYFDGSGDYLVVGSAADWAFLSNTTALWSIEMWVYHNNTSTSAIYFDTASGGSANVGITISRGSSNLVAVNIYRGVSGSPVINASSTTQIIPNAWNHVLITYDQSLASQNAKIYINGGSAETGNKTANTPSSSNPNRALTIGTFGAGLGEYFFGNIGSLRISNVIRSSGVPTTPYTSDANTKLLLNFTNAGILDASGKNVLETIGDAKISTAQSKWGGSSISFDGTGDYVTSNVSTSDLYTFGTGAFTVECWVYLNTTSGIQAFIDFRPVATNGPQIILYTNAGVLSFQHTSAPRIAGATLSAGQWYHVALARSGTDTKMFLNGTQTGSTYSGDTTSYNTGANRPVLGTDGAISTPPPINNLNGYLQDVRITKGYARYTQNFTPPTAKFLAR